MVDVEFAQTPLPIVHWKTFTPNASAVIPELDKLGDVIVKHLDWKEDLNKDQYLVADDIGISKDQIKEHNLKTIKEIFYPDHEIAYRILKTK